MAYAPYATPEYYFNEYKGTALQDCAEIEQALRQASRHIDSLTYNRINGRGFESLTECQRDIIREAVCRQAEFEHENEDEIGTALSGYTLNGTTVKFGSSWNVCVDKGVAMRRDVHALLSQTGLCCRLAR